MKKNIREYHNNFTNEVYNQDEMDKILERYKLLKLTPEEIENINKSIAN